MNLYRNAFWQGIGKIFTLPRLSVPFIATLGLTLGALLCVLAVISALQLKPLPGISKENDLYSANVFGKLSESFTVSMLNIKMLAHLKQDFAEYGIWSALNQRSIQLNLDNQSLAVTEFISSRRIFDTLGLPLIKGESPNIDEVEEKIWISNSLWKAAYSGQESALGTILDYQGKSYQISGIVPDFSAVDSTGIVIPQQIWRIRNEDYFLKEAEIANFNNELGKILLRKNTENTLTPQQLLEWYNKYIDEHIPEGEARRAIEDTQKTVDIKPYRDELMAGSVLLLFLLAVAVLGLLVMASLNLLNLFIAHYQSRHKEFSIQISLGASLNRLRLMLILENLPAFIAAGLLGLLIAGWGVRSLPELAGGSLPMLNEVYLDPLTCISAFFIVLLLALIFSLFAFVGLNYSSLTDTLNSSGKGTPAQSRQWVGRSLMVLQISLATMLLTASVMLAKQSYGLVYRPLGYDIDNSYQVSIPYKDTDWQQSLKYSGKYYGSEYQALRHELSRQIKNAIPEAQVLDVQEAPLASELSAQFMTLQDTQEQVLYQDKSLSKDYFSSFNIQFLAGKNLTRKEIEAGDNLVVIDERMAKRITGSNNPEDAVGMEIQLNSPTENSKNLIVGVVNNTQVGLGRDANFEIPTVYSPKPEAQDSLSLMILMPEGENLTQERLDQALTNRDSRLGDLELTSLQERWSQQTQSERISLWTIITMTGLTLFLAAVGIAGLTQMTTSQKRYELAVRMATGSRQARLLQLVFKDAGWMLGLGLTLGFVLSSLGYNQLNQSVSLMPEFDWTSMLGLDLALTLVVLAAVAIPAWRIIKTDPMQALREL